MIEDIYRHIGAQIRAKRRKLKWKQELLASKLAISRGSLANIEIGNQRVLVHQLYRFAAELKLSPTDLLPPMPTDQINVEPSDIPLPSNLNPQQARDVANFYSRVNTGRNPKKEEQHVKNVKR